MGSNPEDGFEWKRQSFYNAERRTYLNPSVVPIYSRASYLFNFLASKEKVRGGVFEKHEPRDEVATAEHMEGVEQALGHVPESEEAGSSSRKRSGSSNQEMPSKTSRAHATHGGRGAASASSTLAHPMPDGKLRVLEKEEIVAIEAQLTTCWRW